MKINPAKKTFKYFIYLLRSYFLQSLVYTCVWEWYNTVLLWELNFFNANICIQDLKQCRFLAMISTI